MTFNSYTFFIFFAVILGIHYSPISWRGKKISLLLGSYLFYAAWNPPFVILLWISTVVDWFLAKRIYVAQSLLHRKILLAASLTVNLGMLAYFKYGDFILQNFVALCSQFGLQYQPAQFSIVLPVGISFYTFQTLSYTLDIYRKKMQPWKSSLDFALFVTFFPQLVAGPIVRAVDFLPQCETERRANSDQFGFGLWVLVVGLFQKVVLADGFFAPIVEEVYTNGVTPDLMTAWAGTLAFAGQIFCDFAGYSNCAIGVAMTLGFRLPENFRSPYAAIGFSDFWQRWHISLSTWLRDYLYIPLGGNRHGSIRTLINLSITMLLGGLWHGASWTFVAWGALHGFYLVAERLLLQLPIARWSLWRHRSGKIVLTLLTFILICFSWVFFRAGTFTQAYEILLAMTGLGGSTGNLFHLAKTKIAVSFAVMSCLMIAHWLLANENNHTFTSKINRTPWFARSLLLTSMLLAIIMMPGKDRAFIYFQF